jgi:hypothetical protein|tara:strand:- start:1237 stop:1668 length:432 start_codon:yes stop_codon:yes gene_type:complete
MANEPMPADDLLTDFNTQWDTDNVAKPNLVVVTGNGEPLRFDLNAGDALIARNTSFTESPIGTWQYANREYGIQLEVWTLRERQRLFNIMQEIRRICHARMHNLTNFQRLQFVSFSEATTDQVNVWMGTIQIALINDAVLMET